MDVGSGKASTRESRVVTSFLFGRRLRCFDSVVDRRGLVTFDKRAECFMRRLSAFVVGKREESRLEVLEGFEDDAGFT